MAQRVSWDRLEEDEEHVARLDGVPFTGIAAEMVAGRLVSEVEFRSGLQSGVSREWYDDGILKCETEDRLGTRHGQHREWRPDGSLAVEATYEYGILVEQRDWDQTGRGTGHFLLDETAPLYATLMNLRKGRRA